MKISRVNKKSEEWIDEAGEIPEGLSLGEMIVEINRRRKLVRENPDNAHLVFNFDLPELKLQRQIEKWGKPLRKIRIQK